MEPGSQPPVDLFPVLKYVPERWANWKVVCRDLHVELANFLEGMLASCETRIAQNMRNGSLLESILEDKRFSSDRALLRYGDAVVNINLLSLISYRGTLGAFMEGATETTAMFLRSLILMLVASPETQVKVQKEIDAVVGTERAPVPSDFEQLPYVQATMKEVNPP